MVNADGPGRENFDLVVLGAGSTGKYVANEYADAGHRVAVVEQMRLGGECPYVSCMPSKALLFEARERRGATSQGAGDGAPSGTDDDAAVWWARAVRHRDDVVHDRDDSGNEKDMHDRGIEILRGHGAFIDRQTVEVTAVDGTVRVLVGTDVLIATGSAPTMPPIDGLDTVPAWTSDQILSSDELPARLIILGGGPIGCELSSVYATFGSAVTLVESAPRLLPNEDPSLGVAMAEVLAGLGVEVVTASTAVRAAYESGQVLLDLDPSDGPDSAKRRTVRADRLLVSVGRKPVVDDIGLEALELPTDAAIAVDTRCRVTGHEHLFAGGDVVGLGAYTHVADYHARLILAELGGHGVDRDDTAIPRVVYTDPPVAAVGLTAAQAAEQGIDVVSYDGAVSDTARAGAEDGSGGPLVLHLDRQTGTLVGGGALGPQADSWMTEVGLAIRAKTPITTLAELIHAFPTWGEGLGPAYRELATRWRER